MRLMRLFPGTYAGPILVQMWTIIYQFLDVDIMITPSLKIMYFRLIGMGLNIPTTEVELRYSVIMLDALTTEKWKWP